MRWKQARGARTSAPGTNGPATWSARAARSLVGYFVRRALALLTPGPPGYACATLPSADDAAAAEAAAPATAHAADAASSATAHATAARADATQADVASSVTAHATAAAQADAASSVTVHATAAARADRPRADVASPAHAAAVAAHARLAPASSRGRVERVSTARLGDAVERGHAHTRAHGARREWAAALVSARLGLQSAAGRAAYERAAALVHEHNQRFRGDWHALVAEEPAASAAASAQLGAAAHAAWQRLRHILVDAERAELDWELAGYGDLIALAERDGRRRARAAAALHRELHQRSVEYLDYARRRADDDPDTREYGRKRAEQKLFTTLWALHAAVRALGFDGDGLAAPLTFMWKTQAYFIARAPEGVVGIEPMFERTYAVRKAVWAARRGRLAPAALDRLAGTHCGLNQLTDYLATMCLFAPDDFAATASAAANGGGGLVAHFSHTGMLDYAGVLGSLHLLGLPPAAIVAERMFKHAPVMADYLAMRGVFLSRDVDTAAKEALYRTMHARVADGMTLAMFGAGTRALGWPLVSPFAELDLPGTLHLPGEFIPSRDMTGMAVRVACATRAPLLVMAMNLHRGGIPEPSLPRDAAGFFTQRNMFSFCRLGAEDGWAAVAALIPAAHLQSGANPSWPSLQADVAQVRFHEMRAGFAADAGPPLAAGV